MPEADPVRRRLYPSLPCRVFLVGSFVIDRFGDFSRLVINGRSVSRTSSAYYYSAKVGSGGDSEENSLNCLDREFHKFFMVNASFYHMDMLLVIPPFQHPQNNPPPSHARFAPRVF